MKYYVTMELISHHTIEVEADDFDDAMDKALEVEITKDDFDIEEALPISAYDENGVQKDI